MTEMKDSGFAWTGSIPKNWKMERLQWHLDEINEKNDPVKTERILSLTNKLGVIPYEDKGDQGNKAKTDVSQYKIAYSNTIVANSMNILIGSVGISKYYGCVSPVYYVFRAKKGSNLKFVNYILQCPQFQKELRKYANGILEIRLRLSSADILKRPVPFPDLETQNQIVDYLDYKCADIDSAVSEAKASIEDYKVLRQSIITHAVTKGLNPDAIMAEYNNLFYRNIPSNWHIVKISNVLAGIKDGEHGTVERVENGELYLSAKNMSDAGVTIGNNESKISHADYKKITAHGFPQKGDVLLCCVGATIGKCCIYPFDNTYAFQRSVAFLRVNDSMTNGYLRYCLQSTPIKEQESLLINKSAIGGLYIGSILKMMIPYPPIDEQKKITDYLDKKCKEINEIISNKQLIISDLESYKRSLIYECVTGKREVPNA
ncbi:restriction endonuclease subunit S [Galactobacillus timonensis]|uniref:restriction endonuclease subunit S n=1 Tax=Galactobacillus timonensis TaxID=2041840 RepID=UPI001AEC445E|nr:restriction endonuclease subunit S [Galactobacillus timonensis]